MSLKRADRSIPSTTIVLGPYGDVVRWDDRHLFVSWYTLAPMSAIETANRVCGGR